MLKQRLTQTQAKSVCVGEAKIKNISIFGNLRMKIRKSQYSTQQETSYKGKQNST